MTARRLRLVLPALALAPLVFVAEPVRTAVEGRMPLHMLVQFPLLLVAGACAARLSCAARPDLGATWSRLDAQGLLGLVTLSGVAALWMVPAALDAALMQPGVAAWKYASWWIAGAATALAWPRMAVPLRLFLLGNLAWMLFTAGALYAETGQRLCVSYGIDDQLWTAAGLHAAALALIVAGISSLATGPCRPRTRSLTSSPHR